jgi:ubiquitin-conjugating enzyme E2 W
MTVAGRLKIVFIQLLGLVLVSRAARETLIISTGLNSFRSSQSLASDLASSRLLDNNIQLLVRGGGDVELSSDEEGGVVLSKIRNILRNILKFGDKEAPVISNILRSCLKSVEKLTGLKLLPAKKSKNSTKKSGKKAKAKKESAVEKEADSVDEVEEEEEKPKKKKTAATLKKPSATTKKHLTSNIKNANPNYRIQRELKEFLKSPPPNLSVQVGSNIRVWVITMVGAENTIYEGEVFKLRVSFPPQYPTVPPSVYFLQGYVPLHEHVYTNGDICLSLLGKDWRPTMTAQSIAVSILSILSSAQAKSLPMDNSRQAGNKPGEYQKDWVYHDDNC